MKKIIIISFFFFLLPLSVGAVDIGAGQGGLLQDAAGSEGAGFDVTGTTETTFATTLGLVVRILMSFAGVIFMILMVYAGYLWMTARGEEAKIDKAQAIIKAAIIGLVIAVGAYSITNFIVPRILTQTTPEEVTLE